jgi:hypothetical protein
MRTPLLTILIALVGGQACSSSSMSTQMNTDAGGDAPSTSTGSVSQKVCALTSACAGGAGSTFLGFGELCESLQAEANLGPSLGGSDAKLFASELACLERATDCASFQACVVVSASVTADCGDASTSVCASGYAVQCGEPKLNGLAQGYNCGGSGLVCAEDEAGAGCGTSACDPSTTKPSCDGDNLVTCATPGGALTSINCKYEISTPCGSSGCQSYASDTCAVVGGTAMCAGTGAACAATTKNSCDGTSIVSCTGGKIAKFDCATEDPNATCAISTDGSAECVGAGKECTTMTPETCAAGVVTYCLWGTKTTVDCKSYGLSGCTTKTTAGVQVAGCMP